MRSVPPTREVALGQIGIFRSRDARIPCVAPLDLAVLIPSGPALVDVVLALAARHVDLDEVPAARCEVLTGDAASDSPAASHGFGWCSSTRRSRYQSSPAGPWWNGQCRSTWRQADTRTAERGGSSGECDDRMSDLCALRQDVLSRHNVTVRQDAIERSNIRRNRTHQTRHRAQIESSIFALCNCRRCVEAGLFTPRRRSHRRR